MTCKQAATLLGCHPRHVRALIVRGKLRATLVKDPYSPARYDVAPRDVRRYATLVFSEGWPRGKPRIKSIPTNHNRPHKKGTNSD